MYLWQQHASRRTGRCAAGCRVSTGLVGVVVLMLSYITTRILVVVVFIIIALLRALISMAQLESASHIRPLPMGVVEWWLVFCVAASGG